jgi:hypothetical protein
MDDTMDVQQQLQQQRQVESETLASLQTFPTRFDLQEIKKTIADADKELRATDFVHPSMVELSGIVVQFINSQAPFSEYSAEVIGSIRIPLLDPAKAPVYLTRYKSLIKTHAKSQVEQHFQDCNFAGGLGEPLSEEDFSMKFSWATLSLMGKRLNPSGRDEGPIWYAIYPNLIEPVNLARSLDFPDEWVHVINCYVHLLHPNGRRNLAKKNLEQQQEERRKLPEPVPSAPKLSRLPFSPRVPFGQRFPRTNSFVNNIAMEAATKALSMQQQQQHARSPAPTPEQLFPGLPASQGPLMEWNKTGLPKLPEL